MRRGTNPTIFFDLPFDTSMLDKCHIAFSQGGNVVIEKMLTDCTLDEKTLKVELTETDTLALADGEVEIQIRAQVGTKKLGSNVIRTSVERILKEGLLDEITGGVSGG